MFQEYDVIKTKRKLSNNVDAGTLGTILIAYNTFDYEVEFVSNDGNTLDILTVHKDDMELLQQ